MVNLNIDPNEKGIKRRCAKIAILLSLKKEGPLTESELKMEASRRNYNDSSIASKESTRAEDIPNGFNHIISENISKGNINKISSNKLTEETKFELTDKGEKYTKQLFEETLNYID